MNNNTTPHLIKLPTLAILLSAYADDLESGTRAEQEASYALTMLAYAIRNGKTNELEDCLGRLADRWLEESCGETGAGVDVPMMVLEQN